MTAASQHYHGFSPQRTFSVARKELLHILRDPTTLFFSLVIPIMEMLMLGYAIDTNVRNVPTVVFDAAQTQESRELIRGFENTDDFEVVSYVYHDEQLSREIIAGRAQVGIKIPEDFRGRPASGDTAEVLVIVDGSQSSVASGSNQRRQLACVAAVAQTDSRRQAAAGRSPARSAVQSGHAFGELFYSRPARRDVPDDGRDADGQLNRPRKGKGNARTTLHDARAIRRIDDRQADALPRADGARILHHFTLDGRHFPSADPRLVLDAAGPGVPVHHRDAGTRPLDLDQGGDAGRFHADVDGDRHSVDLSVGLCVPRRFDAAGVQGAGQIHTDNVDDRRLPRRRSSRSRVVGPLHPHRRPVGHGGAADFGKRDELREAAEMRFHQPAEPRARV